MMNTTDLCTTCGQVPIEIQTWDMCRKCYQRFRSTPAFTEWKLRSPEARLEGTKKKLIGKYSTQLFTDFERLEKNPYPSLQTLADRYGLSRERIRQIYKMFYGRDWKAAVTARRSREEDIGCSYDPVQKLMEYEANIRRSSSSSLTRTYGEIALFEKCKNLGIPIITTPGNNHRYIINLHPVLLHTTERSNPTNIHCTGAMPYHRVNTSTRGAKAEYMIVCILPKKIFYILPEDYWIGKPVIYIPHRESKYREHRNDLNKRLLAYKDRWDFLTIPFTERSAYNERVD